MLHEPFAAAAPLPLGHQQQAQDLADPDPSAVGDPLASFRTQILPVQPIRISSLVSHSIAIRLKAIASRVEAITLEAVSLAPCSRWRLQLHVWSVGSEMLPETQPGVE